MADSLFADPRHTGITQGSLGVEKLLRINDFSTKLSQNRSILGDTPSKSIKTHWFLMIPTSKSTISRQFFAMLLTFLHMNCEVVKPMRDLVRLGRFLNQSNPLGEIR